MIHCNNISSPGIPEDVQMCFRLGPQSFHHLHKITNVKLEKHLEGKQCNNIPLRGLDIHFQDRINHAEIDYGRVLSCC
jgi:hypothetical protein